MLNLLKKKLKESDSTSVEQSKADRMEELASKILSLQTNRPKVKIQDFEVKLTQKCYYINDWVEENFATLLADIIKLQEGDRWVGLPKAMRRLQKWGKLIS